MLRLRLVAKRPGTSAHCTSRPKAAFAALLLTVSCAALAEDPPKAAYPDYPSETPEKFAPVTDSYDYTSRDLMIAMRDGVKLHTIIVIPKGASHAGMLLTRTPYNAKELTSHPVTPPRVADPAPPPPARSRILIADDNRDSADTARSGSKGKTVRAVRG
jgi:predicted acyl esterase